MRNVLYIILGYFFILFMALFLLPELISCDTSDVIINFSTFLLHFCFIVVTIIIVRLKIKNKDIRFYMTSGTILFYLVLLYIVFRYQILIQTC